MSASKPKIVKTERSMSVGMREERLGDVIVIVFIGVCVE
jgi:hypothetical protein